MLRVIITVLLLSVYKLGFTAISVVDDAGNTIRLSSPAKRIVSLAPHVTELLFSIHAGDRLVATVEHSDFPPAAKQVRRIGGYNAIDLESIITLEPDLIIAWRSGNSPLQIEKLQSLGMTVYINEPRNIEDISDTAQKLAILTDKSGPASVFINEFKQRHTELRKRFNDPRPVKIFYEVWHQPLMTINGQHLISDVIRLCGADNIFADVPVLAPTVSVESVLQKEPDIIVTGQHPQSEPKWELIWRKWQQIPAVANNQLYAINPDLLQRHGPRILLGAEQLCQYIARARKVKYANDESLQIPTAGQ